ncbi:MAG: DUF4352 domain-containing protein [Christensenellales bacterium]
MSIIRKGVMCKLIVLLILLSTIATVAGCIFEEKQIIITNISLADVSDERVEWSVLRGDFAEYKGRFTVTPSDANYDDLKLVFDNEDIIEKSSISSGFLQDDFVYKVKGKYNGKVTVYISTLDDTCVSEQKTIYFVGGPNNPNEINLIGETVTDLYYNVDYKINKITNSKSFTNGYYTISTSNNFLLIEIEVQNKGADAYYLNPADFNVKKYEDNKFITNFEYDYRTYQFENGLDGCYLNYGVKKTFTILFEIDQSTTLGDYRLSCPGTLFYGGVIIHLKK